MGGRPLRRSWEGSGRRLVLVVLLAAVYALTTPLRADAAPITLGRAATNGVCPDNLLLFNGFTAPGGPTYRVPEGNWRITSFGIDGGLTGGVGALVVLRPTPTIFEFTIVYSSAAQTLTAGMINTFPASALVTGDDFVGLWMGSGGCGFFTGQPDDIVGFNVMSAPPLAGTTFTVGFATGDVTTNIEVTLEPVSVAPPPLPPPPPRLTVCTRAPILRADGSVGVFAEILLSQYGTTDESSPYYGAQPAIFVEGFGLMCQISEVATYGGDPSQFRDSGRRVDGTGQTAPPGLESVWIAPYPYWSKSGQASPGTTVSANPQTFVDPAADNRGGSPDVTTVEVSNDDAGMLEFRIAIPNRTDLTDSDFVALNLDTDQSDATGCNVGAGIGVDWAMTFAGHTEPASDFSLLIRYEGCDRSDPDLPQNSLVASFDSATSTLVFRIDRAQLGNASMFRFFVTANVIPIGPETGDLAGDTTPWVYQVLISTPSDRTAPRVKALSGSGVHGKVVTLRYSVFDDSGRAREEITTFRGRRVLSRKRTALGPRDVAKIYSQTWRVPSNIVGTLRFCVQAWDEVGNRSAQSCARLTIR